MAIFNKLFIAMVVPIRKNICVSYANHASKTFDRFCYHNGITKKNYIAKTYIDL